MEINSVNTIHLMDMVIDSQLPEMKEKPESSKVLQMSRMAFNCYTKHLRRLFPREDVKENFSYRQIGIEVFESGEFYISIQLK